MVTATIENDILSVIAVVLFVVKGFALVDAITRKQAFFPAADKLPKLLWVVILALSLVFQVILRDPQLLLGSPLQPLNLAGTIVSCIYLADVRPALRAMRRY